MSVASLGVADPGVGVLGEVPASASVFQAGLASPENSEQLIIALEPEAASIYCRKLRLYQMIELSKAAVNGYSSSDTVGAGFAQGTSALSLPLPALSLLPPACLPASDYLKALCAAMKNPDPPGEVGGWF